jgi:hypothetical protein
MAYTLKEDDVSREETGRVSLTVAYLFAGVVPSKEMLLSL